MKKLTAAERKTRDVGTADSIVQKVRQRMARAAELAEAAKIELQAAARRLRAHPDFQASVRARAAGKPLRESTGLAWWLNECIKSVLQDGPLDEAAGWIQDDLRGVRSTLREFIRDEERVLARQAAAPRSRVDIARAAV